MKAAPFAETVAETLRYQVGSTIQQLIVQLARQAATEPAIKAQVTEVLSRWADGNDRVLADLGRQGLASIAAAQRDYLAAAIAYEESAAKLADAKTVQDRQKHDMQLIHAARNYQLARQPERALKLLLSFQPELPSNSLLPGYHAVEIGACYEALGQPEQALASYLRAAEIDPGSVDNTPVVACIVKLGGVPLRADRQVDVRYLSPAGNRSFDNQRLASIGSTIYLGGLQGIYVVNAADETWKKLDSGPKEITCLEAGAGQIWAGTKSDGLWRV